MLYIVKLSKHLGILERKKNYESGLFVPLLRLIGDLLSDRCVVHRTCVF